MNKNRHLMTRNFSSKFAQRFVGCLILLLASSLIACGGGGGGGGSEPATPKPTATPAPAPVDTDSDGVADASDTCANTPAGEAVDAQGCSATQRDSDADGVVDASDQCAETPAGEAVDANGCAESQKDDDSDGVINASDTCPDTPAGEAVDASGCGVVTQAGDSDGDGVADSTDDCPNTPADEILTLGGCSDSQIDSDMDGITNDVDTCDATPASETIDARGCGTVTETGVVSSAFVESEGLVVVDLENTDYSAGWTLKTGNMSAGNAYLVWEGDDFFNAPGSGLITIPVKITTPGTYRFIWHTVIDIGDSPTESNDSWLKIEANSFFGKKLRPGGGSDASEVGHIVCPVGKAASNVCEGEAPEGSSSQGYLKVYRTGGPVEEFKWSAGTSDRDYHDVMATFDAPGTFNVIVSARSKGHGLDRLVLHRSDNADNNIGNGAAQALTNPESARE